MSYGVILGEKMDKEEIQRRIKEEEDYIRCPKFSNSLTKFVSRNSEGVEDSIIARMLLIPEEEVLQIYAEAIEILRTEMVESENE